MEIVFITSIAALISSIATPLTIRFATKFHLVTDKSRKHPAHTHTGVIPRTRGIPIFISFLVC